ncbi:MAG TPA: hypothetical protein VKM54_21710 [Myxococcota bacterium]|nr:hypothetical protein [Myxococcota bacterium]
MERFCVESRQDEVRGIVPWRIGFAGALQDVVEILDQWVGQDHRYFRVRTADDARFLLRLDEIDHSWSLVFFEAEPERPSPSSDGSG